jgi:hypothetical protein
LRLQGSRLQSPGLFGPYEGKLQSGAH